MRIRHMYAGWKGSWAEALTKCGLFSAKLGELVHELDEMNCPDCRAAIIAEWHCPVCGTEKLEWGFVEREFFLGCGYCGETLKASVSMADVADMLTQRREVL
jgi:hypothetical protein